MTCLITPHGVFSRDALGRTTSPRQLARAHSIAVARLADMQLIGWPADALGSFRDDIAAVEARLMELGLEVPA